MKKILCKSCAYWVDCKKDGFCMIEDLFTTTARTICDNYEAGVPLTEDEWEEAQRGCLD